MPRAGLECRHESLENHRDRRRCRDGRDRTAAGDRHSLQLSDLEHPGGVEQQTGYRLAIGGTTRIGVWPSLNVTLNDVTLQDPKDATAAIA